MEWNFRNSPYNYCFNNPVSLLDPNGMYPNDFSSDINQLRIGKKGSKEDPIPLPEVTVTAKGYSGIGRFFRKLWRAIKNGGESQQGGIPFVTEEGGASPTTTTARHPDTPVNIDKLLPAIGGAGAGPYEGRSPLSVPEGLDKLKDILSPFGTSDRKIEKGSTGTAKVTDAHGRVYYIHEEKLEFGGTSVTIYREDSVIWKVYSPSNGDTAIYKWANQLQLFKK